MNIKTYSIFHFCTTLIIVGISYLITDYRIATVAKTQRIEFEKFEKSYNTQFKLIQANLKEIKSDMDEIKLLIREIN